jgi:hypothetical protein
MAPQTAARGCRKTGSALWRKAIDAADVDDRWLGSDREEAVDEARGLGSPANVFALGAAAMLLALLPIVAGLSVLMGWTVALGIGIGVGVSAIAAFKAIAMGWGIAGVILDRLVAEAG